MAGYPGEPFPVLGRKRRPFGGKLILRLLWALRGQAYAHRINTQGQDEGLGP